MEKKTRIKKEVTPKVTVKSVKRYEIIETIYSDDTLVLERRNTSFTTLELLGLLTIAMRDIQHMFYKNTEFEPDTLSTPTATYKKVK